MSAEVEAAISPQHVPAEAAAPEAEASAAADPAPAPFPKSKRGARSRELASLLENISNLAPPPSAQNCAPALTNSRQRLSCSAADESRCATAAAAETQPPSDRQGERDAPRSVALHRNRAGESIEMNVTGAASGVVYGDIVYADDSSLAAAAVHAGLLSVGETRSIRIYILGPYKNFVGSFRNGIKSHSYPKWPGSFAFASDALEQALAAAMERKRAFQERRAAKKNAKGAQSRDEEISPDSDGNSTSSSDSEHLAAHWDTPAVPEHLKALAESGYVMKYDGEYRRDALKRTSKVIATINLQSISDDVLFMEASGSKKKKRIRTKPRRFIPAGAKEIMAYFATDDTKVVPVGDSADPDFLPTPFEYAFEVKDVSKFSKEEDDAESCQVCGCSPCDGVLSCADDSCVNRSLMIECCEETCLCRKSCNNRRFQLGQYSNLRARRMPDGRGWGLICTHNLKPGDFCCEYVGERITCNDTVKRMNGIYRNLRHTYLLQLGPDEVIDATRYANLLRFTNHSCNPNCEMQKWNVRGVMRVGLFAIKEIPSGTELCFDYQMEMFDKKPVKCLCGATNCRGWLGKSPQEFDLEHSISSKKVLPKKQSNSARQHTKERAAVMHSDAKKGYPNNMSVSATPAVPFDGQKRASKKDEFGLTEKQRRLQLLAMEKLQQRSNKHSDDQFNKVDVLNAPISRKRSLDVDEFGLSSAQRLMQIQAMSKLQKQSI